MHDDQDVDTQINSQWTASPWIKNQEGDTIVLFSLASSAPTYLL